MPPESDDKIETPSTCSTHIQSMDSSDDCETGFPELVGSSVVVGDDARIRPSSSLDSSQSSLNLKDDEDDSASSHCSCLSTRCCGKFAFFLMFVFFILLLVILVGAFIQDAAVEKRYQNTTLSFYRTQDVCGWSAEDNFASFPSASEARRDGYKVAHCGACGQCSTEQDITIMSKTRYTLTEDATKCSAFLFFGGRHPVERCLSRKVGFTSSCEDCWVDNIKCTARNCIFTCLKFKLLTREENNEGGGDLNDCLKCDEIMCGADFLNCAGANRRRLGIVSDIERDQDNEQCDQVDFDW